MTQTATNNSMTAREAALARRRAMSTTGKAALSKNASGSRVRGEKASSTPVRSAPKAASVTAATSSYRSSSDNSARAASLARRRAMSTRGKVALSSTDRTRSAERSVKNEEVVGAADDSPMKDCGCGCKNKGDRPASDAQKSNRKTSRSIVRQQAKPSMSPARAASLARRQAQSARGKAGINAGGMTTAQTARAGNPNLTGRELAKVLRSQRSSRGGAGKKKSGPCGRIRPGKAQSVNDKGAQDAPWKVGASETSHGMTVTGTMVGRKFNVTGDEPSTCRAITGTEYLGADVFRNFCQTDPMAHASDMSTTSTARGNQVTGNEVSRSENVTGNEQGTCKNVTGSEYVSAMQPKVFCGTEATAGPSKISYAETVKGKSVTGNNVGRSDNVTGDEPGSGRQLTGSQYMQSIEGNGRAHAKVGMSQTLRGGSVTGAMVGRSESVTGDEQGSCRNITGDDYVGQEQYGSFCKSAPEPRDFKVGVSKTFRGESVSGTMTGRSEKMTGDESGTCKAITGTPYAGTEQYEGYCETNTVSNAAARMQSSRASFGAVMTGQQPGIAGKMTGDDRGSCEPVTGTPYVGADQAAMACPATAATPMSPDFPQQMAEMPWGKFSVEPPAHASDGSPVSSAVTGSQYEHGAITGPFGMAAGKVTGTEQARFGRSRAEEVPAAVQQHSDGRIKSRVTGEGQDAGSKITGDDWNRGDHVTGTEGHSATVRNPSMRGTQMGPMGARATSPVEAPSPVSRVTGSSGNTENGSLITYSGGARG